MHLALVRDLQGVRERGEVDADELQGVDSRRKLWKVHRGFGHRLYDGKLGVLFLQPLVDNVVEADGAASEVWAAVGGHGVPRDGPREVPR